jgi:hypothetical protein
MLRGMRLPRRARLLVASTCCALVWLPTPSAEAAQSRTCRPVVDPYPNTRFEGADLRRIIATGVSCRTARRVARRAHRKALGLPPPRRGVRRFRWRSWRVTGDLRPSIDRYVARRDGDRVRWVFS